MGCHICTYWTPEKGCKHYGPELQGSIDKAAQNTEAIKRIYAVTVTSALSEVMATVRPPVERDTYEKAYGIFTTICHELDALEIPPMPSTEEEIVCECRQYFVHLKISTEP